MSSSSWLDQLPSLERQRIRERLRSPAEYERLRDKVRGPEDLERELKHMERLAETKFRLETDPAFREALKERLKEDIAEQGIENILENADITPDARLAVETGKFNITIEENPRTHEDEMVVIPEGIVREALPIKLSLSERYYVSGLEST